MPELDPQWAGVYLAVAWFASILLTIAERRGAPTQQTMLWALAWPLVLVFLAWRGSVLVVMRIARAIERALFGG